MGQDIQLTAKDGFELAAYEAQPSSAPKGCVLVIQEIFGVNKHIREVCDGYAADGYLALAPAIFDRVEKNVQLGYEEADMGRGMDLAFSKLKLDDALTDLQAGIDHLGAKGKVGVVGYCFGGLLTWLCAARASGIACASSYYGGGIAGYKAEAPKVPTLLHFGDLDAHIPMADVEAVRDAQPAAVVHMYSADHGFNCDHRASYDAAAAQLARERTLAHFAEHLAA